MTPAVPDEGPSPLDVPYGYRVGRWEVRGLLASGAFAGVYEAQRGDVGADDEGAEELPRVAALKFLPTGTLTPRRLRHLQDLAERELELHRKLRASRLNTMYEALTVDDPRHPALDGATVLVLERAEGSLRGRLLDGGPVAGGPADNGSVRGGLPGADAPELLAQVCEGLVQLHEAGWVHGDLKPGNVLLMADGSAQLGDFNLAAEMEGTHAYAPAFSTPDYTPPEVLWSPISARGQVLRPTADIWAFGVLAHLVLTGARPLPGGTVATRRDAALRYARGLDELRLSPELPSAWRPIVTACLAPSHEERAEHTAATLLRRIRAAPGTDTDTGPDTGTGTDPASSRRRRPRLPALRLRERARRLRARHPVVLAATSAATVSALIAGVLLGPLSAHSAPGPASYGYKRCPTGSVCFFSEQDGNGRMCSWTGDDTDWQSGHDTCRWARTRPVRSIFNNDAESKRRHDVEYHWRAGYERREDGSSRIGCTAVNTQGNLAGTYSPGAHRWIRHC